jgi:hypothetical protein
MRKGMLVAGLAVLVMVSSAVGANFNLTGQGARAMGMGGAFIGIADDATAISWNPAGLAQLDRPELSAVFKWESKTQGFDPKSVTMGSVPITLSADESNSHFVINFGSGVFPLKLKERNLALAIAYQQQLDFFNIPDSNTTVTGGANTISPGLAYQITPQFALGAAANIWMGSTNTDYKSNTLNYTIEEPYSGLNFFVGGWGNVKPVKFGAIIRTPLTLKYHDEFSGLTGVTRRPVSGDWKIKMPFMFGFGAAVEPTQNITIAADVDIRPYSSMEFLDSADVKDTSTHPMSITQIRLGAEYLLMLGPGIVPLRVGFRTDPRTYTGTNVTAASGWVSDGKQVSGQVFSFGTGFVSKKFQLDGAFEFGSTKEPINWDASYQVSPSTWNWKDSSKRFLVSGIVRF